MFSTSLTIIFGFCSRILSFQDVLWIYLWLRYVMLRYLLMVVALCSPLTHKCTSCSCCYWRLLVTVSSWINVCIIRWCGFDQWLKKATEKTAGFVFGSWLNGHIGVTHGWIGLTPLHDHEWSFLDTHFGFASRQFLERASGHFAHTLLFLFPLLFNSLILLSPFLDTCLYFLFLSLGRTHSHVPKWNQWCKAWAKPRGTINPTGQSLPTSKQTKQ